MNRERRKFLAATTGTIAAISLPGWPRARATQERTEEKQPDETAAAVPAGDDDVPRTTAEAIARAKRLGRPLLVLVMPKDDVVQSERARLFGLYVFRIEDGAAAELALCELWCATIDEVRSLAPDLEVRPDLLALLVEPDRDLIRALRGEVKPSPRFGVEPFDDYESHATEHDKGFVTMFSNLVHAVLAPDEEALRNRVRTEQEALVARGEAALVATLRDSTEPTLQHATEAPAWLLARARKSGLRVQSKCFALALAEITRRWRADPPPRTRWATDTGCATEVEYLPDDPEAKEDRPLVGCGMGFIPEYSQRLLVFYTSPAR